MQLKVKILSPGAKMPGRATPGASGFDLFAFIDGGGSVTIDNVPKMIGTGIAIEVPTGYDAQIRPRSGLSLKGIGVTLGTVDSDYRGEVMVTMYSLIPGASFAVKHGDRIAQLVISRLADISIVGADELSETERGSAGHGSTGR